MNNKALFLDRDGIINIDHGHVYLKKDFILVDGIQDLIRTAISKKYKIIVITNQAGIGKGYYTEKDFFKLSEYMKLLLEKSNCFIDKIYFCPYHPTDGIGKYLQDSFDRKPNPGMLLKAKEDFNLDMNSSILIGDKVSDVDAGINANVKTNILLNQKNNKYDDSKFITINKLREAIQFLS